MAARRRDVVPKAKTATANAHVPEPEVLVWSSFARDWFEDAWREAQTEHDYRSRCREILFAVCFAESYLFEWVRDDVLKGEAHRAAEYYRRPDGQLVRYPWEEVPKNLLKDKKRIPMLPDFGGPHGKEWRRLVEYRNGLVHAKASVVKSSLHTGKGPVPSKTDLDKLERGWALGVAIERVKLLHEVAGTPPAWLVEP